MNKRRLTLTVLLLGLIASTYGQNLEEFTYLLENCGMNFKRPEGVVESPVINNPDMLYEYALKYPDKDFEVRYSIRPITNRNYANDSVKTQMEGLRTFRNTQYETVLKAVVFNVSGGSAAGVQPFDKPAVNKEFNADWGGMTFFEMNSEFGKGFTYCMVVAIHKKDAADAYCFYLSNSKEMLMEYAQPLFHSLRFD